MRRALLTTAFTAVALAAAASPAAGASLPASVRLVECSFEDHEAAFRARMRLVDGADTMGVRFTLLERSGVEGFRSVEAPGLRRWHWSKPGVGAFGYRQGLRNLPENASHRVKVQFRWYSSGGEVVAHTVRRSSPCRQFVTLPNLVVRITRVAATTVPGVVRYEGTVSNTGRAPVTSVPVRLTVDGDIVNTVTLTTLLAGEERSVLIRGPECHTRAELEADPDKAITENSEEDNLHELTCG
jgi:hypothetical protein